MSKRSNDFDRIAPFYDILAKLVFGNAMKKAQTAFLDKIPSNSKVLIIGGGTGWILVELFERLSNVQVVYVESSAEMLSLTNSRLMKAWQAKVKFIHGNQCDIEQDHFDVIITHFFLDLFKEDKVSHIINTLKATLKPNGKWLFCDFELNNVHSKYWQKILVRTMINFFKLTTNLEANKLIDLREHLKSCGLKQVESRRFYKKMIVSCIFEPQ
ncbi:class I SAM-dependent methyltransferase [Fulvivirgaceae bacterium BMA10]|uniref:Class I SAM-dependent methyltransferase n=1 Tax=Splendidivirga corallicola TaxID=3051826 RepID=A0ABT8KWQ6_9BACT|nr:class I SAM-dependent methyltransferase [Fulvivirgaceae bacterium BMA10]